MDTSFSTDGMVLTDVGVGSANDYGRAVAVDSDDRVVVAGSAWNGSNDDFGVARYVGAVVPGAPSGVTGVAGDGVVAVSWVVPSVSGGAVVTDYVVEYSRMVA